MRCVVDANVLMPILTEGHAHRGAAVAWWDGCEDDAVGLLLRLLTNARVMGSGTLRPAQAWSAVQRLVEDPRITVVDQAPAAHAKCWYDKRRPPQPTPDLWTDAWLAALAQATGCEMVTFDRGFRSFSKLELRLLEAAS